MGKWRKRTEAEIEASVRFKDYTGGYEFGPWLLWMRKMYVVGFLGNLAGSIIGWKIFLTEGDYVGLGVGIFFALSTTLIGYKIRKDYTNSKKGVSE